MFLSSGLHCHNSDTTSGCDEDQDDECFSSIQGEGRHGQIVDSIIDIKNILMLTPHSNPGCIKHIFQKAFASVLSELRILILRFD